MDIKPCSPKVALNLYELLEYYREYVPYMLKMSHEQYATTQECKNVDEALAAYRAETGVEPEYPIKNAH